MENTTITEKIISGLRKAAVELEEFRLQAALGKAEAIDHYEKAAKEFRRYVRSARLRYGRTKSAAGEAGIKMKALLEELQLQLALGKAETRDAFNEQKESILKLLDRLERYIRSQKELNAFYAELLHEIWKFRIKMEILRLRVKLDSREVKRDFEKRKKIFSDRITELKEKFSKTSSGRTDPWARFSKEMNEAYTHMKKAFSKA